MVWVSVLVAAAVEGIVMSDLLEEKGDAAAVYRIEHTLSSEPSGCCACDTQMATAEVIACVNEYAARRDCQCRLDYQLLTNYFYMCRNDWRDTWMYEQNAMLTGGPHKDLEVDSVSLGLLLPWARVDACPMWPSLWRVNDVDPCATLSAGNALDLTYVPARFDMAQYMYTFEPDVPLTVPVAWAFTAETGEKDACPFWLKEVITKAHMVRGLSPVPQLEAIQPYNYTRDGE